MPWTARSSPVRGRLTVSRATSSTTITCARGSTWRRRTPTCSAHWAASTRSPRQQQRLQRVYVDEVPRPGNAQSQLQRQSRYGQACHRLRDAERPPKRRGLPEWADDHEQGRPPGSHHLLPTEDQRPEGGGRPNLCARLFTFDRRLQDRLVTSSFFGKFLRCVTAS